jgi:hypothetical protein
MCRAPDSAEYPTYKKSHTPITLLYADAYGPRGVLRGWVFSGSWWVAFSCKLGTPVRKRTPLGPYGRSMPRVLGGSYGSGCFLMGEVPLQDVSGRAHLVMLHTQETASRYPTTCLCLGS